MADVPGDVTGLHDVGIALASLGAGFGWEEGLGRAGRWAAPGWAGVWVCDTLGARDS